MRERIALGELGEWGSGGTPLASRSDYYGGDIPWLTIEDLDDGVVEQSLRSITRLGLEKSSAKRVPAGTILIAMYGASIGKLGVAGMECATNQAIAYCRPDSKRIVPEYLFYLLMSERSAFIRGGRGGAQPNISQGYLKTYEVELPPLEEQRRTAAILHQVERALHGRRYALELSDRVLSSAFQQLFRERLASGPFQRLGDVVRITGGGTPARSRPQYYSGDIPWLTSKDMRGEYIWDTEEHITEEALGKSAAKLVPAGSVLLVVKSKVLAHRLPVAIARVPLCHGQDVKSIQPVDGLDGEFTRFVLKHHERTLLGYARGANTEGLTLPMLEDVPVPEVTPAEQRRFSDFVREFERFRESQREALAQTEHLRLGLLATAFVASAPEPGT